MPSFSTKRPVHNCQQICCSGFFRVEKISQNLAARPCLTNEIHIIFARERFERNIEYAALEPALRLATHLIEASLPFWYSIIHNKPTRLGIDSAGRMNYELPHEGTTLTNAQKTSTRQGLIDLAAYMTYRFSPLPMVGGTAESFSETSFGPRMPEKGLAYAMDITIVRNLYLNAITIHEYEIDVVRTHWSLFNLARTLVHELAHACTMTVMWKQHYPPLDQPFVFFGGSLCAEEGFEWEAQTFGGIIDPAYVPSEFTDHLYQGGTQPYLIAPSDGGENEPSILTRMLTLADYPNKALVRKYQSRKWDLGCRGSLPNIHTKWNIDFESIHRMFQDDFWRSPMLPGSLHFPKRIGYRFFGSPEVGNEGEDLPVPFVLEDGRLSITMGIPPGYRLHFHPPNGGIGLILAPEVSHPYGPEGYIHLAGR